MAVSTGGLSGRREFEGVAMKFEISPRRGGLVGGTMTLSNLPGRRCYCHEYLRRSVIIRNDPEVCGTLGLRVARVLRRLGQVRRYSRTSSRFLSVLQLISRVIGKVRRAR